MFDHCEVVRVLGTIVVRDEQGCVALRREDGTWIDAFGGIFTRHEVEALDAISYGMRCALRIDAIRDALAEYGLRRARDGEPGRAFAVLVDGAVRIVWATRAPEGVQPYDADPREHYQTDDERAILRGQS